MAEVQSQSAIAADYEAGSQVVDRGALLVRLDELLEKYLHTLDEYQKTRAQLAKQLSSGYLSLAQANFQNRTGAHYGQDNYDERMQAIRKVAVQVDDSIKTEDKITFSVVPDPPSTASKKDSEDREPEDGSAEAEIGFQSKEKDNTASRPVDPLRWFGILVPPALRSAQSEFIGAMESSIPRVASIARDLRNQEIEIGRVRKQIKKS